MSAFFSLNSFRSAPIGTDSLPPPLDGVPGAQAAWTSVPTIGKRLGLVTWVPSKVQSAVVDVLILGDSYADDIDMGYLCWPTIVCRSRRWNLLNAARGGNVAAQGIEQYERAIAFARESGLRVSGSTLCMIHLGGNNLLHALWLGPLALVLLGLDVLWISLGLLGATSRLETLPRHSFAGWLSQRIVSELSSLLRFLGAKGQVHVMLSDLPLCASVPTMRIIIGLMLWPLWAIGLVQKCCGVTSVLTTSISAIAREFARLTQARPALSNTPPTTQSVHPHTQPHSHPVFTRGHFGGDAVSQPAWHGGKAHHGTRGTAAPAASHVT